MARQPKVASDVARRLMKEVAARGLVPGDHLAAEHELIDRLGVARGSVREGLRLLEAHGVIELRRGAGGGATIAMPRSELLASALAMALQFRGGDLGTVMEARSVIEPTMAALAAQRRKDEHVAALDNCVRELRTSTKDSERFHQFNRRFHDVVAEASGNVMLAVLMPSLSWMSAAAGWELPESVRKRVAADKGRIAEAIELHDSWQAAERMRQMVMRAEELERKNPTLFNRPIVWADVDQILEDHLNDDESQM